MNKPIERVYVIENHKEGALQASGFDVNPERAERFAEAIGGTVRVFTEEPRWIHASVSPSDSRGVLVRWQRRGPGTMVTTIVALFGSEGKWVAVDHDLRRTYLSEGTVLSWREMPELPVGIE